MFGMGSAFFGTSASYATLALTGSFAAATVGVAYSSSIAISGGVEPYALTGGTGVSAGSLDSGFSLAITGSPGARLLTLSCASPATADTMSFTASVGSTDAQTATSAQSVIVAPANQFATYMASLLPVAWWRMGDAVGSSYLNDSIANEQAVLTGVASSTYTLGSTGLVSGDSDTAVTFTGGLANTGSNTKWALGTGDFSAFIIAKWTSATFMTGAGCRDSTSAGILFLFTFNRSSTGDVGCEGWNWSTQKISVAGTYNDGVPHVLGLTYEASTNTLRFYIDGVLKQTQVQSGALSRPLGTTLAARIANNYNAQYFSGTLDEYALFNRLLSDAEMAAVASLV